MSNSEPLPGEAVSQRNTDSVDPNDLELVQQLHDGGVTGRRTAGLEEHQREGACVLVFAY